MHNKLLIAIMTCAALVIGTYFATELKKGVGPQKFRGLIRAILGCAMMIAWIYLIWLLIVVLLFSFGGR